MFIIDRNVDIFIIPITSIIIQGVVARFLDGEAARNILHPEATVLAWCREVHEGHVSVVLDIKIIEYHSPQGAATAMGLHADR